jgi:hypothetical protein
VPETGKVIEPAPQIAGVAELENEGVGGVLSTEIECVAVAVPQPVVIE